MAICRHYGRADFFITFTCNPQLEEITANLPPGFSASDRPDIVARVFSLKLKTLLDDLLNKRGGERFYLRLLLTVVKGPTTFDDLRTFEGVLYDTFKSACIARGLLDSDEQWNHSLMEAAVWQNGSQLRELFVCILLHCHPASPSQLWMDHVQSLSDYCAHKLRTIHQITEPSQQQVQFFFYLIV